MQVVVVSASKAEWDSFRCNARSLWRTGNIEHAMVAEILRLAVDRRIDSLATICSILQSADVLLSASLLMLCNHWPLGDPHGRGRVAVAHLARTCGSHPEFGCALWHWSI